MFRLVGSCFYPRLNPTLLFGSDMKKVLKKRINAHKLSRKSLGWARRSLTKGSVGVSYNFFKSKLSRALRTRNIVFMNPLTNRPIPTNSRSVKYGFRFTRPVYDFKEGNFKVDTSGLIDHLETPYHYLPIIRTHNARYRGRQLRTPVLRRFFGLATLGLETHLLSENPRFGDTQGSETPRWSPSSGFSVGTASSYLLTPVFKSGAFFDKLNCYAAQDFPMTIAIKRRYRVSAKTSGSRVLKFMKSEISAPRRLVPRSLQRAGVVISRVKLRSLAKIIRRNRLRTLPVNERNRNNKTLRVVERKFKRQKRAVRVALRNNRKIKKLRSLVQPMFSSVLSDSNYLHPRINHLVRRSTVAPTRRAPKKSDSTNQEPTEYVKPSRFREASSLSIAPSQLFGAVASVRPLRLRLHHYTRSA